MTQDSASAGAAAFRRGVNANADARSALAHKARSAIELNLLWRVSHPSACDGSQLAVETRNEGDGRYRILVLRDGDGADDAEIVLEFVLAVDENVVSFRGAGRTEMAALDGYERLLTAACRQVRRFRASRPAPPSAAQAQDDQRIGLSDLPGGTRFAAAGTAGRCRAGSPQ
jgi:hypothetical protein